MGSSILKEKIYLMMTHDIVAICLRRHLGLSLLLLWYSAEANRTPVSHGINFSGRTTLC